MNPTAIYALSLAGGGLTVVVGSVVAIACRSVAGDADRIAAAIARSEAAEAARAAARTPEKELVR